MARKYLLFGSERYALAILRPLQSAIRNRGDKAAWFFDGPGASDLDNDEHLLRDVTAVREFNPEAVFAPGNHIPHFFPGLKVMIFHGFDAGKPRHVYVRGYFDLYCTTGPADTAKFQNLAKRFGHFSVVETGWPKLDPFSEFSSVPNLGKPVILYHSTFSPRWSAANVLYEEVKRLAASGRWRWIVTLHPKTDPETVARFRALEGDNLEYAEGDNILELFPRADVMVSDTSSAISEYLLWHKPVVTFENRRPGPHLIDISDPDLLEPSIERALERPPELMHAIQHYASSLHTHRDGLASKRILNAVDEFIDHGRRRTTRKPISLWRRVKMRRRLNYFLP